MSSLLDWGQQLYGVGPTVLLTRQKQGTPQWANGSSANGPIAHRPSYTDVAHEHPPMQPVKQLSKKSQSLLLMHSYSNSDYIIERPRC